MSDDGSVIRSIVIDVLKRNGTDISSDPNQTDMYLLVKGELVEIIHIPERCARKTVRYFSRKFGAPIHHFYNPIMAPQRPDETTQ